jgi:hypothetical protein
MPAIPYYAAAVSFAVPRPRGGFFFWKAYLSIKQPLTAHGPIHPQVSSRHDPSRGGFARTFIKAQGAGDDQGRLSVPGGHWAAAGRGTCHDRERVPMGARVA